MSDNCKKSHGKYYLKYIQYLQKVKQTWFPNSLLLFSMISLKFLMKHLLPHQQLWTFLVYSASNSLKNQILWEPPDGTSSRSIDQTHIALKSSSSALDTKNHMNETLLIWVKLPVISLISWENDSAESTKTEDITVSNQWFLEIVTSCDTV